jgi:hypothetical protein
MAQGGLVAKVLPYCDARPAYHRNAYTGEEEMDRSTRDQGPQPLKASKGCQVIGLPSINRHSISGHL